MGGFALCNSKSPVAEVAVRQIAPVYTMEATVHDPSPDVWLSARRAHSLTIVAALKPWFEKQLSMISSGSTLAEDIRYALNHWLGLTRFLGHGRLELDTNPIESAVRPICLTKKWLLANHEVEVKIELSFGRSLPPASSRLEPPRLHRPRTRGDQR
ncbi:IS66 family transposase [Bradyrhizobium zhanjiangense]|uniref:IS66 family transposase n=1 Tax=Bradyrhizobium zhanjiangense TaxID=1325107 RepID=UPI001008F04E|nr:transposase [Bradyrhizobium zhanjiangense]